MIRLRKTGAAFLALTMIASFASMTGCSGTARKTEITTTSATSEETTEPKATETSAAETTSDPEKPAKGKSDYTEAIAAWRISGGGPAQANRKIEASLGDNGVLSWNDMVPEQTQDEEAAISYRIYISGVCVDVVDPDSNSATARFSKNLKKLIDAYIKSGQLERSEIGKYTVLLIAELDLSGVYASWQGELVYESKAKTAKKLGKIDACIDENGKLTWKSYKGAEQYLIYVNEYFFTVFTSNRSILLKKQIDFMIKCGFIKKADTYDITISAFDDPYESISAKWSSKFSYASDAVSGGNLGTVDGLSLKNGILSWNNYEGSDTYYVEVFINGKFRDSFFAEENKYDVNDYIAKEIYEDDMDMDLNTTKFTFRVSAVELSCGDAFGIFESERFVMASGLYGDYKLEKVSNPLSVSGKEATVSSAKLSNKKQTIAAGKVFEGLSTGRGGFVFTKLSGDGSISINKSSGTVTIKKNGLKKGQTYPVSVRVVSKGNAGYEASSPQEVAFTIKVT
ncbi:MAG: hypothetical protein K6F03_09760 [Saccharofermentans sp.]|nr:hypothetical protein [Saccharofermentans sp.]